MSALDSRRLVESITTMELPVNYISNSSEVSLCIPDSVSINRLVDDVGGDNTKSRKSWRFWVSFAMLYLCAFPSAIDATILSTALPQIALDLKASSILTFWCATSFLLAKTIVQPIWGNISEIFGRKQVLLIVLTFFFFGSILCGFSISMVMLVVSRAVQGIGAGGLGTMVEVLIADMVPLADRGIYWSVLALVWAVGTFTGPVIGASFVEAGIWQWIFFFNAPICLLCFVGIAQFLDIQSVRVPFSHKIGRIDWMGILVFTVSVTSLLFGITLGGTIYEWTSWQTLVTISSGVVGIVIFVIIEVFYAKEPMIPFKVFSSSTAASAYFGTFLHGMAVESWIYLVFWFESVRIRTPIGASIDVLPIVISTALSAATAGVALKKWGRFKYVVSFGWVFATFGTGLLCFLSPVSNTGRQIGFQFVQGIGLGILFPALQLACQAPQSKQDVGMAVAIFAFLRSVGETFGVALGGIIFQNQFDVMISMETGNLPPEFMISGADATGFVAMLPAVPAPFQMVLRYVYANSLRGIWVIITALTAIGLLTSFLSKDLMLDQKDNVDQESEDIRDYIEIS